MVCNIEVEPHDQKAYLKPEMQVVLIQHTGMLMTSGQEIVNGLEWQDDIGLGFGGSDADLGDEVIIR